MATLEQIIYTLKNLTVIEGELSTENIEAAIKALKSALEDLETIAVKGKDNLDKLLGVILAIDMIIGEEEKGE